MDKDTLSFCFPQEKDEDTWAFCFPEEKSAKDCAGPLCPFSPGWVFSFRSSSFLKGNQSLSSFVVLA